jgi:hypothetical protein
MNSAQTVYKISIYTMVSQITPWLNISNKKLCRFIICFTHAKSLAYLIFSGLFFITILDEEHKL